MGENNSANPRVQKMMTEANRILMDGDSYVTVAHLNLPVAYKTDVANLRKKVLDQVVKNTGSHSLDIQAWALNLCVQRDMAVEIPYGVLAEGVVPDVVCLQEAAQSTAFKQTLFDTFPRPDEVITKEKWPERKKSAFLSFSVSYRSSFGV